MDIGKILLRLALWVATAGGASAFDCIEKKCGAMASCAEAYHHLTVCGEAIRDRDNDGIPCENVCGKSTEEMRERLRQSPAGAPQPAPPPS
jgi:hypothetical protein